VQFELSLCICPEQVHKIGPPGWILQILAIRTGYYEHWLLRNGRAKSGTFSVEQLITRWIKGLCLCAVLSATLSTFRNKGRCAHWRDQ
jgi:hypothetical protein